MIIVDTNVIVYLYTTTEFSEYADVLLKKQSDWRVPYLWRSEFCSVLVFLIRTGKITLEEGCNLLYDAQNFFYRKEYRVDSADVLKLAAESGCSVYDCEFISLAQYFDTFLITMDSKLLNAFPCTARKLSEYVKK